MPADKLCAGLAQRNQPACHQVRQLGLLQVRTGSGKGDRRHRPDWNGVCRIDIAHGMNRCDTAKLERVGHDL